MSTRLPGSRFTAQQLHGRRPPFFDERRCRPTVDATNRTAGLLTSRSGLTLPFGCYTFMATEWLLLEEVPRWGFRIGLNALCV